MTDTIDPDDPVVGDETVLEGEAALSVLDGFHNRGPRRPLEVWAAVSRPKHAHEISDEVDIPIATVYRMLNDLSDAGLIRDVEPVPPDLDNDSERPTHNNYFRRVHDQITLYAHDDEPRLVLSERPPYDPKRRLEEVNRDV